MRFKRSQRIQELLHEEISKLVQSGLKDPRIGFTTITKVEVSDNLKHAKIFFSVMGTEQEKTDTLDGLISMQIRVHPLARMELWTSWNYMHGEPSSICYFSHLGWPTAFRCTPCSMTGRCSASLKSQGYQRQVFWLQLMDE